MPQRTFVDSNVLIAAHRGEPAQKSPALNVLTDQNRFFIAGPFLALELLPKPLYYANANEIAFYRDFLDGARLWIDDAAETVRLAHDEAAGCGLSAMDAPLVAAAYLGGAEEFFTLEGPEKPMHRTRLVRVLRI